MKNKLYFFKIIFIILLFFYPNSVLSDEFEFNAASIETSNEGNLLNGFGGVEITDSLDLVITGDQFEYDKLNLLLTVKDSVLINDKLNNNQIKTNQITFNKKLNIITSFNKTIIELNSGHIIESSNIIFNRNLNTLFSNDSKIGLTGLLACLCTIVLMVILFISKKIKNKKIKNLDS